MTTRNPFKATAPPDTNAPTTSAQAGANAPTTSEEKREPIAPATGHERDADGGGSRGKNGPRIAVHYGSFKHVVDELYKNELRMYLNGQQKKKPSESDVALRLMKLGKRYLDEKGLAHIPDDL